MLDLQVDGCLTSCTDLWNTVAAGVRKTVAAGHWPDAPAPLRPIESSQAWGRGGVPGPGKYPRPSGPVSHSILRSGSEITPLVFHKEKYYPAHVYGPAYQEGCCPCLCVSLFVCLSLSVWHLPPVAKLKYAFGLLLNPVRLSVRLSVSLSVSVLCLSLSLSVCRLVGLSVSVSSALPPPCCET